MRTRTIVSCCVVLDRASALWDENRRIREQLLHSKLEAAEARAARELAEARAMLVAELEYKNEELEAFSHSVSHDLRAPLRGIDGPSQALLGNYTDRLDETGQNYLSRILRRHNAWANSSTIRCCCRALDARSSSGSA